MSIASPLNASPLSLTTFLSPLWCIFVTPVSDGPEGANRVDSVFFTEYAYMTIVDHEKWGCSFWNWSLFSSGPYFDLVNNWSRPLMRSWITSPNFGRMGHLWTIMDSWNHQLSCEYQMDSIRQALSIMNAFSHIYEHVHGYVQHGVCQIEYPIDLSWNHWSIIMWHHHIKYH